MSLATLSTLAWLFINPLTLPAGMRLWMLLPLVACVAAVYRATRARSTAGMLRQTTLTFVNIILGMVLIAAAFYAAHLAVRYWS